MISKHSPVPKLQLQSDQPHAESNNPTPKHKTLHRKLSMIHQRVTQGSSKTLESQRQQMRKTSRSKSKVKRWDTKQTDLSVSESSVLIQQTEEESQMNELIKRSENDPFLRSKLKNLMKDDIKSLKRWNSKNPASENQPSNTSGMRIVKGKNSTEGNTSQILDEEYKRIPRDISSTLIDEVLHKKGNTVHDVTVSRVPARNRDMRYSIDECSAFFSSNPVSPRVVSKQQFTTLRRQSYKGNVIRLEMLREMQEKQKVSNRFVVDKLKDKTNLDNKSKGSKGDGSLKN